uniref:Lkrsdh1 n=1 Tax=Arundo donax TaxID=35708 RepID=A0A0A9ARL1_ARUDO
MVLMTIAKIKFMLLWHLCIKKIQKRQLTE